jgi:drug/metabolite transporter (DMT)-like permease
MYFFLATTSILKTFTPYFRKHILNSFESHEFFFLNSLVIFLFGCIYFLYRLIVQPHLFDKLIDKVVGLTSLQMIYFMIIAFVTVFSSIVIIHFDKHYNTPLINSLLTRGFATISLILVGIFIYNEKYNHIQLFGIFLTVLGLFLTMSKE